MSSSSLTARFYLFAFSTSGNVEQFALHELHSAVEMVLKNKDQYGQEGCFEEPKYARLLLPQQLEGNEEMAAAVSTPCDFTTFLEQLAATSPMALPGKTGTTATAVNSGSLESKGCRRSASTVAHSNDLDFSAVLVLLDHRSRDGSREGSDSLDAQATAVAQRCCLVKGVYKPFAIGPSVDAVVATLTKEEGSSTSSTCGGYLHSIDEYTTKGGGLPAGSRSSISSSSTFRYDVETYGRKVQQADKIALMQKCQQIPHLGTVNLKTPELQFVLMLFHHSSGGIPAGAPPGKQHESRALVHTIHCLELCQSHRLTYLEKYSLKTRPYIGTTSMPPELCFTMCNLAQVQPMDLIYDPFCGTGSTCVAATHYGAHCLGTDMDGRVLRAGTPRDIKTKAVQKKMYDEVASNLDTGKSKSGVKGQQGHQPSKPPTTTDEESTAGAEGGLVGSHSSGGALPYSVSVEGKGGVVVGTAPTMWTNFAMYNLASSPDRIRMNFSCWSQMWRPLVRGSNKKKAAGEVRGEPAGGDSGFLDAIMCDPPYGVREQKKKVDASKIGEGQEAENGCGAPSLTGQSIAGSSSAEEYATPEMLLDLILFAAESLKVGGRLVYWHPTDRRYTDAEIPRHPQLKLLYSIEQLLTLKTTRWLVTMEKVSACPPGSVDRESCRPQKDAANLRTMMDDISVEGERTANPEYAAYRNSVEKTRLATSAYNKAKRDGNVAGHGSRTAGKEKDCTQHGEGEGEGRPTLLVVEDDDNLHPTKKPTKSERRGTKTRAEHKEEMMRNRVKNQVFIQRKAMLTDLVNKPPHKRTPEEQETLMVLRMANVATTPNLKDGSGFCRTEVNYTNTDGLTTDST